MKEVAVKGHAHSANQHWYRKVDGVWKFAGLKPDIRWCEYDFEKVFESGREELGTNEKEVVVVGDEKELVPEAVKIEIAGLNPEFESETSTAMLHAVIV